MMPRGHIVRHAYWPPPITPDEVLRLWRLGYDTLTIAQQFNVAESVIYNLLAELNDPPGGA